MPIKAIVELQAKPGQRDELKSLIEGIFATHGASMPGRALRGCDRHHKSAGSCIICIETVPGAHARLGTFLLTRAKEAANWGGLRSSHSLIGPDRA